MLFAACKSDDDEDTTSESESLEYDLPSDDADSEYQIANDLSALQHDDDEDEDENGEYTNNDDDEYDYDNYDEEKSTSDVSSRGRSTTSDALIADIENLSIANDPKLARNARVSVKMSSKDKRGRPLQSVQTPQLFVKQHTKIKKKKQKHSNTESNKYDTNRSSKTSSNSDAVRDAHKKTVIRITRSSKVFSKSHIFGTLLVKPAECGSGCPLYRSSWKGQNTVTKLMPLWENAEFTKEENVDNALREFEFHADIYRKGCKSYGVKDCPVVSIIACVKLRHPVVSSQDEEQRNESPTRRYQTRGAVKRGQKMLVKKPYLAFVMPQLHCNLAQFVSRYRKLTEEEGRRLLVTGVRFLSLLETAEMVHCDIKPENIFLDVCLEEEDPVINAFVFGDFGCAAKTTEEFPYGSLTGTVTMWDLEALVGIFVFIHFIIFCVHCVNEQGTKYGKENGFELSIRVKMKWNIFNICHQPN